jgi:hypothetical protein
VLDHKIAFQNFQNTMLIHNNWGKDDINSVCFFFLGYKNWTAD